MTTCTECVVPPDATQTVSRRMPDRAAYPVLLIFLGLALAVSGTPSPLYGGYAHAWRMSPLTLTLVFAAYAVAAMGALLVAGPLTDAIGRKPALLMSAAGLVVGLVMFMAAHDVAELIIARMIHGASISTAAVAVGAALLDLRPDDGQRAGRLTGIVLSLGMGGGVLSSALVAQLLPDPLVLPYAGITILALLAVIALALIPETHQARTGKLRIVRPGVPAEVAGDFGFATLGAMASWVMLGIYLSLFPLLTAQETGIHTLVFGGGIVAAMMVGSAIIQAFSRRVPARRLALFGDLGLVVAGLASVPMVLSGNPVVIVVGAVMIGAAFGTTFSGSLRHLNEVIPAGRRGGVISTFYLCCYGAMAVPTVLAGAAASHFGLPDTYAWFAVGVSVSCLAAAALAHHSARSVRGTDDTRHEDQPADTADARHAA